MLGALFFVILVSFLKLRGFLSAADKSLYGLIILVADIYALNLTFDIAFGDTSKFLQGSLTSVAADAYGMPVLILVTAGTRGIKKMCP